MWKDLKNSLLIIGPFFQLISKTVVCTEPKRYLIMSKNEMMSYSHMTSASGWLAHDMWQVHEPNIHFPDQGTQSS